MRRCGKAGQRAEQDGDGRDRAVSPGRPAPAMRSLPRLVAHADWSVHGSKRWMAVAELSAGVYELASPERVDDPGTLLSRLRHRSEGMQIVVGFDFPIGLPRAYVERAGIGSFIAALPKFGQREWLHFYELAETASEISVWRPFYPRRPGGTSHQDLVDGLGVDSMDDLLRACDRGTKHRPKACHLFWTLGANQVGRAALSGWREVICPALQSSSMDVAIWPFDGRLEELMGRADAILAETYPAEACRHLGIPLSGGSKRRQADRRHWGGQMLAWAAERQDVRLSSDLGAAVRDGFSGDPTGEDRFDAVVGLMSMLEVITGRRDEGVDASAAAMQVEGWIFGQQSGGETVPKREKTVLSPKDPRLDAAGAGRMTRERLLSTARDAGPVFDALLALEGEESISFSPRQRCLSMRASAGGQEVPMMNLFERGTPLSRVSPCLYIDGNVQRDYRGHQHLEAVRRRLEHDYDLWRLTRVDMRCDLDHRFTEDEIRRLIGFARWLRDRIRAGDD